MTDKNYDKKKLMPGIWYVIHNMAIKVKTFEDKIQFITFMTNMCKDLPCGVCRDHCSDYIKNHPFSQCYGVRDKNGRDICLFKWTWEFHNAVNSRIGKPILDFDTAYSMYSDSDVQICKIGCGT